MTKISKDFQDYDDEDPQKEFRENRWNYWSNLRKLKQEFYIETQSRDPVQYLKWLENKYGFKVGTDFEGNFTDSYKIVDEKKYIVYVLKYGK